MGYYVVSENSSQRLFSGPLPSIEECIKYMDRAKVIDAKYKESYQYGVVVDVPYKEVLAVKARLAAQATEQSPDASHT